MDCADTTALPGNQAASENTLVISVVSHGHGVMVQRLLHQISRCPGSQNMRVVLTLNVPEPSPQPPEGGWSFRLDVQRNTHPQGFGANHNQALQGAAEAYVCVLNPDVVLIESAAPWTSLVDTARTLGVGCAYPLQKDTAGRVQDSEREWPSPLALWRRRILRQREARADWVNAACIVLTRQAWRTVQGFDTRYFMYCEDVDLCLRLRLAGFSLARAQATIEHEGMHASHRNWQHLRWHVGALLRLWCSSAYRQGHRLQGKPRWGCDGVIGA